MRKETSYYKEIKLFIEKQVKSNFAANKQDNLHVYWEIGELTKGLERIINGNKTICQCAEEFALRTPPLNLDIFALITDGKMFEILILEVKLVKNAGLMEWSQLVGYCLVSGAKYGLLVNIDNGASNRLTETLRMGNHLSHIDTMVNNQRRKHYLGFMGWNSVTKNLEYHTFGEIKTISDLSYRLMKDFKV